MELIYCDEAIVVAVKPARVLSTDEPGGLPELSNSKLAVNRDLLAAIGRQGLVCRFAQNHAVFADANYSSELFFLQNLFQLRLKFTDVR